MSKKHNPVNDGRLANGKREQVLKMRREDPKHEKYTDKQIAEALGLSRQRVHQILTDYIKRSPFKNLDPVVSGDKLRSRYEEEEWYSHRKKKPKQKYNPKFLGNKYKPSPIDKDNPKLK